jgi:hypothetical protein
VLDPTACAPHYTSCACGYVCAAPIREPQVDCARACPHDMIGPVVSCGIVDGVCQTVPAQG